MNALLKRQDGASISEDSICGIQTVLHSLSSTADIMVQCTVQAYDSIVMRIILASVVLLGVFEQILQGDAASLSVQASRLTLRRGEGRAVRRRRDATEEVHFGPLSGKLISLGIRASYGWQSLQDWLMFFFEIVYKVCENSNLAKKSESIRLSLVRR